LIHGKIAKSQLLDKSEKKKGNRIENSIDRSIVDKRQAGFSQREHYQKNNNGCKNKIPDTSPFFVNGSFPDPEIVKNCYFKTCK